MRVELQLISGETFRCLGANTKSGQLYYVMLNKKGTTRNLRYDHNFHDVQGAHQLVTLV